MTPRIHQLDVNGIEIAVRSWGNPSAPTVVAWHGFARTGLDFATLADVLANDFFVVAPDTPGRGLSAWLPPGDYRFETYTEIARELIAKFSDGTVNWVGTSMGGIIGMLLAESEPDCIGRLVLNDIGPEVPQAALDRIASYTGILPIFPALSDALDHFQRVYAPFGPLSDQEWDAFLTSSLRRTDNGVWTPHYDPTINQHFGEPPRDADHAWERFAEIPCPILLLRGACSDILTDAIASQMTVTGKNVQRIDFPDIGHAPFLNTSRQIEPIRKFLLRPLSRGELSSDSLAGGQ